MKSVWLLFLLAAPLVSCSPRAALTPQAAFHGLRSAFRYSDASSLEKQLSRESVNRIRRMTALFSRMDERQLESLSKKFGVPAAKLRSLSVRDYCALSLAVGRDKSAIGAATRYEIVGVHRKGRRAVVRVENGMELAFVKEGPYWKFDMDGL
ncbi:MAG: hypothetical protein A2176_07635 [Spirochaetes bacterium RBG_13_51_14]|nr:MAG: hypothetical protein A2176_07635 [Spirochaetes bacterium RBG_13_51_14]